MTKGQEVYTCLRLVKGMTHVTDRGSGTGRDFITPTQNLVQCKTDELFISEHLLIFLDLV